MNITLPTSHTSIIPPAPVGERRPLFTPLPEPGHVLMVVDNTTLDKIKRCMTSGFYYLVMRREAHQKNAALTFGGALHEGLDAFLLGQSVSVQEQRMQDYFRANPSALDEYRTPETALKVLAEYRFRSDPECFPDYRWEILSDADGLLIERAFEIPLGVLEVGDLVHNGVTITHIHVAWSGRIDLIARCHGLVRVVDHKTTSYKDDKFRAGFQMASQTRGYVWSARKLWPEHAVAGFCLNGIYLQRAGVISANLAGRGLRDKGPRGGEPPLDFFRDYFEYTDGQLAEWQDDTLATLEDFIHCMVRDLYPHNDSNCVNKYGVCPYHSVCTLSDPHVRARLISSEAFRDVTWNPVTKTHQ